MYSEEVLLIPIERSIFRRKISGSRYLEITKSLIVMYVYAGLKERDTADSRIFKQQEVPFPPRLGS
jgi:hypothetical protein